MTLFSKDFIIILILHQINGITLIYQIMTFFKKRFTLSVSKYIFFC